MPLWRKLTSSSSKDADENETQTNNAVFGKKELRELANTDDNKTITAMDNFIENYFAVKTSESPENLVDRL